MIVQIKKSKGVEVMLNINGISKKYLIGGAAIVAIILGIIIAISNSSKIDLMEYATVTITGCNTDGKANIKLNYLGNKTIQEYGTSSLEELKQHAQLELFLGTAVSFKLDKTEGLSNGDVITLSATWDKDIAKQAGLNIKGKDKKIKVEGLPDGVKVDLFKEVKLEYKGASPFASVVIRNESSDPFLKTVRYSIEGANPLALAETNDISNGDTIKINANYNQMEAEKNFYIINQTQKEYKVEGVAEYTIKYSDIDKETYEKMQSQAEDILNANLADKYNYSNLIYPGEYKYIEDINTTKVEKIELKKKYFSNFKKGVQLGWKESYNNLIFVYEVITKDDYSPDGITTYIPIQFSEMVQRDKKTDVDITKGELLNPEKNMDNVYRNVVIATKDRYEVEEIDNSKK